jgi:hypothetical protein
VRRPVPVLVIVGLTLGLGVSPAQEPSSPWGTDLAAARARAASEHRPLAVLFRCEA